MGCKWDLEEKLGPSGTGEGWGGDLGPDFRKRGCAHAELMP